MQQHNIRKALLDMEEEQNSAVKYLTPDETTERWQAVEAVQVDCCVLWRFFIGLTFLGNRSKSI